MFRRIVITLTMLLALPAFANAWFVTASKSGGVAGNRVSPAGQTAVSGFAGTFKNISTIAASGDQVNRVTIDGVAQCNTPATVTLNACSNSTFYPVNYVAGKTYRTLVAYFGTATVGGAASITVTPPNYSTYRVISPINGSLKNLPIGSIRTIAIIPKVGYTISGVTVTPSNACTESDSEQFLGAKNLACTVPAGGITIGGTSAVSQVVTVSAGPDRSVGAPGQAITLNGSATYTVGTPVYTWSATGPGGYGTGPAFDSNNNVIPASKAFTFNTAGTYTVTLTVSGLSGTGSSVLTDTATIVVANATQTAENLCTVCHTSRNAAVITAYNAGAHKAKNVTCQQCHDPAPATGHHDNVGTATVSSATFLTLTTNVSGLATKGSNFCLKCHTNTPTHATTGNMAGCAGCHTANNGDAHEIAAIASNATCLSASCHGNPALVKTITVTGGTETVPLYVNYSAFATTTHGSKLCTSCHTDISLSNGGHAEVPKMYGGWSRFSKNDITAAFEPNTNNLPFGGYTSERTRNYTTAASRNCSTSDCHSNMSGFASSAHATIFKQREAHIDTSLTSIATVCEGKSTTIGEDWANGNCNRCHATCGTCHFKSTITLKGAYPVHEKWDEIQRTDKISGAAVPDNLSEYQMNWTANVASHDFRTKAYFATDAEGVCNACHTGYYRPASNAYYWKGSNHTADTTVCDESPTATWARVKGANVRRHPQATELRLSGYSTVSLSGGKNAQHGNMTCNDCHGTASGKSGNIHNLPGQEYNWDADGDIHCTDCHNTYQHTNPWVAAHVTGGYEKGTKVACIGCHSYGMARDFALADGAVFNNISTTHNVFIDPVTNEVRPVVRKNGHAIAWYPHNWQTLNPGTGKLDPAGDCAKKCHYQGNLVGAGFEQGPGLTEAGKHGIIANTCTSCHNGGGSDPIGDHVTVQNSAGNNVAAGSNECLLCHADFASWADTPHTQKAKIGSAYVNGYNANPALYTGAAAWITANRESYVHPDNTEAKTGGVIQPNGVRAVMSENPVRFSAQTFGVEDITVVIGSNHKQAYSVWMPGYGNKVLNIRYNNLDPGLTPSMGSRLDERTWEGSCIGCHVTGYDKAAVPGTYKDAATSYDLSPYMNDLRIGCVACHGSEVDANGHAKNPADLTQDQQIDICGRCHGNWNSTVAGTTARKDVAEFKAGDSLVYLLSSGYNGGVDRIRRPSWNPADTATKPFLGNGASNDDHQQWYDFKIGKHYGKSFNGKTVTCASCHDPHQKSTEAGRIYGRIILKGSYDLTNGTSTVCVTCHEGASFIVDGKTVTKKGKTGAINPHTGKLYSQGVDLDPVTAGEQLPAPGSLWPWE